MITIKKITPRFSLPRLKFFHDYATNPPRLEALGSSRDKRNYQLEEAQADKHLCLGTADKAASWEESMPEHRSDGLGMSLWRRAVDVLQCRWPVQDTSPCAESLFPALLLDGTQEAHSSVPHPIPSHPCSGCCLPWLSQECSVCKSHIWEETTVKWPQAAPREA